MAKTPVELTDFNPNVPVSNTRFRLLAFDKTNKVFLALDSLEQLFGVAGGGGDGLPPGANDTVLIRDAVNAPVFVLQETGFNLPLGTTAGTVAAGNHTHELDDLLATGIPAGRLLFSDGFGGASWDAQEITLIRASDSSEWNIPYTVVNGHICVDPASLPDWFRLVWYKPRALSTPGAVTSFTDLSGNGHDIAAPAAINEPVLTAYTYSYGTRYGAFYTTDDEMDTLSTVPYSSDVEVLWMGLPDPVNNNPGGDYNIQNSGITRYSTRSAAVSNLLRFQTGRGASTGSPFSTSLLAITQNDSTSAATAVLWPPLLTRSRYKFGGDSLATFLISSTTRYGDVVQHEAVTSASFVPVLLGDFRLFSRAAGTNYGRGILFEILALDHAAAANDTSPLGQYIENWYRYAEDDTTRIHLF